MCVLRLEFLEVPRSGAQSAIPGSSDVCHKTLACFFVFLKDTFQLCQLFDQNVQFFVLCCKFATLGIA
jgi:hypothetical protein